MIDPQIPMKLGEEVDQVRAENAQLRQELSDLKEELEQAKAAIARQRQQLEDYAHTNIQDRQKLAAAQLDAARYRFLKFGESEFFRVLIHPEAHGDTLDATIDSAMKGEQS